MAEPARHPDACAGFAPRGLDPPLGEGLMSGDLVIHGHFYQPPRENPWTEIMEPEPSAQPFHDWNERVYQECYRANDTARIVGSDGIIRSIASNYRHLSFNFGPTLLAWMQKNHRHGYRRLLEADRESAARHGGHGNAIAQGYNHAILPLCNDRDRVTQIRWGLREFRHRFGRASESLWLPETACNDAVLGSLIDEGLRYVILAPGQCLRVRKIGEAEWTPTPDGSVDPGVPYRYLHRDGSGRGIAVFFYDGPISREMAFGSALVSSQELMAVIARAKDGEGRLVSVATDGESYGHHTKWGDRTLSYLLEHEAPARGYRISNFGEVLDRSTFAWEMELDHGPDGMGSSWSCAHGVGRWMRDCGCKTGGDPGWNQAWRGPLRSALDLLRDFAAASFQAGAEGLLKDPWAARDEFIAVVLEPGPGSRAAFLKAQQARELDAQEGVRALALVEMQRQAMLMYTSCGWFFNDLSGIETLQILKYAARLMDDLAELGFDPPREAFLKVLAEAQSNFASAGNGADLFRHRVEPSRVDMLRLAADLAIGSLVEDDPGGALGIYRCEVLTHVRELLGKTSLTTGQVLLESRLTGRSFHAAFAAVHLGAIDFHCCVGPYGGDEKLAEASARVRDEFMHGLVPPLLTAMREGFGGGSGDAGAAEFGLQDLMMGRRDRIAKAVFGGIIESLSKQYDAVYQENRRSLEMFRTAGFELPAELRIAAEYTLSRRFESEIRDRHMNPAPELYAKALEIVHEAQNLGYRVDTALASHYFSVMITESVRGALANPDSNFLKKAIELIRVARRLGLEPNLDRAQEEAVRARDPLHSPEDLTELAQLLYLDPELLLHLGKET
ncbi:MAG: DUF3536 domain-containing protein [candidate division FCPU426 bacterium]